MQTNAASCLLVAGEESPTWLEDRCVSENERVKIPKSEADEVHRDRLE